MNEINETAPAKATITMDRELAAAVEQTREHIAQLTGARPSTAALLQGALRRAMAAGLLGDLPEPRANRAG